MRTSNHQYLQVPGQDFGHSPLSHDVYGGPAPQIQQQTQQQQQSVTQHYQPNRNPPFEILHPNLTNGRHTFEGDINNQAVQAAVDTSIPPPHQRQEVPGAIGYEHYNLNGMAREDEERRVQMQMQNGTDSVEYQKRNEMDYQREMEVYQRELDYQQQQQQQMQMGYHQTEQIEFERRREEEERRRLELDRQAREYERCQQTQQYQVLPPTQAGYPSTQVSQHPQAQYDGYCDQGKLQPPPEVQSRRSSLRPHTSGHDAIYHPSQPAPPPQAAEYQHQPQATMHGQTLNVVSPQQYLDPRETVDVPSSGEPVTSYDGPVSASQVSYVAQSHQVPHEQQQSYTPATYSQYWAAAPSVSSHTLDQQQQQYHQHQQAQQYPETEYRRQYQGQLQGQDHMRQGSQHQPFTPGIVLRDIAADDSRLQDTWMTYMYNVSREFEID